MIFYIDSLTNIKYIHIISVVSWNRCNIGLFTSISA